MALNDIIEKIRADGAAEVAAIVAKRDAEISAIKAKHEAQVRERTAEATSDTTRRTSKIAERILAKARHQVQFVAGAAELSKLESVFSAIKEELLSLDDADYRSYLTKQHALIGKRTDGLFTVARGKSEATTKVLAELGVPAGSIKTEDGDSLMGGFIFTTADQEFDCSYRGLLQNIRTKHAVSIANQLAVK